MENFDNIENEVEKTLNSLNGINQAEPKAFFYTRLHARMKKELLEPKVVLGFQLKPIHAYSIFIVLVVINIFAISNLKNHQNHSQQEDTYSLYQAE